MTTSWRRALPSALHLIARIGGGHPVEDGFPSRCDVMPLAERQPAAREAATLIPVMERAPQSRRNRPGPGADLKGAPVLVVPHHHPARVARQAPGRFRGT